MKLHRAIALACLLAVFQGGRPLHAQNPATAPRQAGIYEGLWEGSLSIRQGGGAAIGRSESQQSLSSGIRLRLLPKGQGALLDIPQQSMYGYPLDEVSWSAARIRFSLDALGPGEDLVFEGVFSASASNPGSAGSKANPAGGAVIGTASSGSWKGTFVLSRTETAPETGEKLLPVSSGGASLPGTLLLPAKGPGAVPLVLLLAGAGTTDRNGNNYNVPGRSDSLRLLAKALAAKGVASYRFDKRGSGESYMLEQGGLITSLTTHAEDAAQALKLMLSLEGFSRIVVAGMNEGAWTGAAAINRLEGEGIGIDGLVVMDASGEDPLSDLRESLTGLDEATKKEADSIIEAILAGKSYAAPAGQLADFFAPSRSDWLKSWLAFQPSAEIAKVDAPVLFIYGSSDLQVPRGSFEKLLDARPNSAARIIPSMNYALKEVATEEENYQSFTDPGFPVAAPLVDLLAAFAKAKPAPAGSLPYDRTPAKDQ